MRKSYAHKQSILAQILLRNGSKPARPDSWHVCNSIEAFDCFDQSEVQIYATGEWVPMRHAQIVGARSSLAYRTCADVPVTVAVDPPYGPFRDVTLKKCFRSGVAWRSDLMPGTLIG